MTHFQQRSQFMALMEHPWFERLTDKDRTAVEYLAFGMTMQDVGEESGCSRQAVSRRVQRVKRQLEFTYV